MLHNFFKLLSLICILLSCSTFKQDSNRQPGKIKINLSSKGNDVAFDTQAIQAPKGRGFEIVFENKAGPDSEILHNIALLKPGSTDEVLEAFEESDYDIDKIRKHNKVLAMTPELNPGEKATLQISREMVATPGYYPYICLIAGHADMLGMKGILHVP